MPLSTDHAEAADLFDRAVKHYLKFHADTMALVGQMLIDAVMKSGRREIVREIIRARNRNPRRAAHPTHRLHRRRALAFLNPVSTDAHLSSPP
ncbi:MAG TPA: hypothetical protein VGF39_06550 [Stellaceae bacterium]